VAGAGLVVGTACSSKTKKAADGSGKGSLAVVQAGPQLLAGVDQRVTLAMFRDQAKIVDNGPATFRFGRNPTALGPTVAATLRKDGIETRPCYQAVTRFDAPGVWVAFGAGANVNVLLNGRRQQIPLGTVSLVFRVRRT